MSIRSKFSDMEIVNMSKEEYMEYATYEDIMELEYMPFNVAVLVRESTNHIDQQKAYQIQKDSLLELVEKKNQFILDSNNIFEEPGKSGLNMGARPVFQLMCQRAREHKFDILLVDSVSRLARDLRGLIDVVDDFRKLGIGIVFIKGQYWTYNMSHNDVLRLGIEGGLAQAESMQTGERVRSHMAHIAKSGQLLGGDMFGYRLKKEVNRRDNSLVQEPIEAYTVRTIFEKFASDNPDEVLTSNSLCEYLISNNMRTYKGDLKWTPSKVIRVLDNTKYMGYQLPEKSRVVSTVSKKKVSTHKEPIMDVYDDEGNLVQKGNLVKINCEPIVSEELWWKAYKRKMSRSSKGSENIKGRHSGRRVSTDAYARKVFCSCGYCLSRQYTHVATEDKQAQHRYKCRWQVDYANKYTRGTVEKEGRVICDNSAVSEMKLWLASQYVFKYLFKNGKDAVLQALELIERCKQDVEVLEDGTSIQELETELAKLKKRLQGYQEMRADGELTSNEYKELKFPVEQRISDIDGMIAQYELDAGKREKKLFDLSAIEQRLNTIVDFKGYKINDEMVDMFVERVIYRGNEEFLWVMNLSGDVSDASAKYRIKGYDEKYSNYLKDDTNFNIVARMTIPIEECKHYCEKVLKRRFVKKYWKPITIKIAID